MRYDGTDNDLGGTPYHSITDNASDRRASEAQEDRPASFDELVKKLVLAGIFKDMP